MDGLQQRIAEVRPRAESLCAALRREAERLYPADVLPACAPEDASYRLERDVVSGGDTLVGEWHGANGYRIGMLVFRADGGCFAELDIVRMHPTDPRWLVEAVEAWSGAPDCGAAAEVRADLRLLAAP